MAQSSAQQRLFERGVTETRWDSFLNKLSDIGTSKDRHTSTQVGRGERLSQDEIDELYETGRFARKVIEKPAKDATRPKIRLIGPEENELFRDEFRQHQIIFTLQKALINARLTGGGALFVGIDDSRDLDEPVNWDEIQDVKAVHAFDRWDLSAEEYETDLMSPKYRKPALYRFHPNGMGRLSTPYEDNTDPAFIHADRILRFEGAEVRDFRRELYGGWGQPILESVFETMKDLGICSEAIASAVHEFQYGVIRIQNLHQMIVENDNGRKLLRNRLMAMEESKSITNAVALDASHDESFEQKPSHLDKAREAYRVIQQNFSYDTQMPISMAFGQMPTGMQTQNGAGRQNYFDDIEDTRQHEVKPAMIRLAEAFGLAAGQFESREEVRQQISVQMGPLDELTAPSAAGVFAQRADGHQKLVKAGVESAEEAQQRLFDDNIARRVPELFGRIDEMETEDRRRWMETFDKALEEHDRQTAMRIANEKVVPVD